MEGNETYITIKVSALQDVVSSQSIGPRALLTGPSAMTARGLVSRFPRVGLTKSVAVAWSFNETWIG